MGRKEWGAVSSVFPHGAGGVAWLCCGSAAAHVLRNILKPDDKQFSLSTHWPVGRGAIGVLTGRVKSGLIHDK